MRKGLPYLASPGTIITCLTKIKAAATPSRITQDFISTVIQIKGGAGNALVPFLKKIGMVSSDGTPTDLYKKYRNQSNGNNAIADAIIFGYKPLLEVNEYFYQLKDTELKDCIVNVTGLDVDGKVTKLIFTTLKNLLSFASFDQVEENEEGLASDVPVAIVEARQESASQSSKNVGLNLSYTINLNLPATADQAVFNAIFKSLKEHLLSNGK